MVMDFVASPGAKVSVPVLATKTWLRLFASGRSGVVRVADDAVVHRDTAVVVEQVSPEQGHVVEHGAVLDCQRSGGGVEDAAAVGCGVAGQRALLDRGRAGVEDAAA